jgi:hypothetical protein
MVEAHERIVEGLFEAKWQPGVKPEFHRGENKQRPLIEERNEADRINQINIEFLNMPVFAVVMPESKLAQKPDSKNSDTGPSFLEIIEMILEVIIEGVKAIFPKRKEMPL